jgi:hypothetical protein
VVSDGGLDGCALSVTYQIPPGRLARVSHLVVGGEDDEDLGSHPEFSKKCVVLVYG